MEANSSARKVLLVGVDESLMPQLAQALQGRELPAMRVTLSELTTGDPGGVAVIVLSTAASRVAQPRMLKAYIDAPCSIVALSREASVADKLRNTTGASVIHMTPTDGAQEVASQIAALINPAEDISSTATVRPPPGMLPEEVEKEISRPHRQQDLVDAERARGARKDSVPELESDLLESMPPSTAPPAGEAPAAHPPPPPAPPRAAPPSPPQATPTPAGAPSGPPPRASGGLGGKIVGLGLLGLGVIALGGVGAWVVLGGTDDGSAPTAEAPTDTPAPAPERASPEPAADEAPPDDPSTATGPGTAEAMADAQAPPAEPAEPPAPEPAPVSGTLEERIAAAREADVERDPRESDRKVLEARQQMRDGDLGAAARSLARALELDPENPRTHAWLGRLHTARGEAALAVQWLERAVDERPRRSEYRLWLGDALLAAGDADGARRAWFRVRRDEGDSRELRERLQRL